MPIKRCSDQKDITLEEFYIDLSKTSTNFYAEVGKEMLVLVQLINEIFKETLIWGLTSHSRLVLQNTDDWKADWFVIVSFTGTKEYYFEYRMPADKRPWENAYIYGQTNSLEEAQKYLLIAMIESGGWSNNLELKRLMLEQNQ